MWWAAVLWLAWVHTTVGAEIDRFRGDPGFHQVKLSWSSQPAEFTIRYCEEQDWGQKYCGEKDVVNHMENEVDPDADKKEEYSVVIDDLKMATNYTFQLKAAPNGRRGRVIASEIQVRTKEFSAVAQNCTGSTSDVEVQTGPKFNGKISVEGVQENECSIYGNGSKDTDAYMIKIDHNLCKSNKTNGTIVTYVRVQENLVILTHSTKRFKVVCNYSYIPESFTVRAGVSLPSNQKHLVPVGSGIGQVEPEIPTSNRVSTQNNKKSAKYSAAKVIDKGPRETQLAQMVLMVILVVAAVIGCAAAIWWFVSSHRRQHTTGFMSPQTEPRTLVYENIENFVREQCANSNNVPVEPNVELLRVSEIPRPGSATL